VIIFAWGRFLVFLMYVYPTENLVVVWWRNLGGKEEEMAAV